MTKQENYQLNYNQPTAPSYDGWKSKPSLSEMERWSQGFRTHWGRENPVQRKDPLVRGPQPDSTDYNGGNYKDRYKVLADT